MDDELLNEFLVESNENMASIEQQLNELEERPDDRELLDAIFRTVHTVKGSCGFLGLERLQAVAHAGEDLLGRLRSTGVSASSEIVALMLECADAIQNILDAIEMNGAEPDADNDDLIARLRRAAGELDAAPAGENDAAPETEAPADASWMEGLDDAARNTLQEAGLDAPAAVLEAGFEGLKQRGLAPAIALKVLGMAKSAAKQTGGEKPGPAAAEPPSAPTDAQKKASAKPAAEQPPKGKQPEGGGPNRAGKSPAQETIRVSLDVLDSLMNQVGELVLTRNRLMQVVHTLGVSILAESGQDAGSAQLRELLPINRDLNHITERLQDQLLKTRMQPISTIWGGVPRVVRDMARQLDKKIKVVMDGQETELDRTILATLKDPLTHIIRNSCDHGIEPPAERKAAGKPDTGVLRLAAHQESGAIVIRISDDGAGIDAERVKAKAVDMGVISSDAARTISDSAALQLIFHPGLSTARKVSNISGRGVGMDVVKSAIEKAGGNVVIESERGKGTTLNIRIPLTMAIMSAMVVSVGERRFAIPQMNVQELLAAHRDSGDWETVAGQTFYRLRGRLLPVMSLSRCMGQEPAEEQHGSIVVIKAGNRAFGLLVDVIHGAEELVVKPLGSHFRGMNWLGGCSILGDGYVIPIIECNGLAQMLHLSAEAESAMHSGLSARRAQARDLQYVIIFRASGMRYALPMTLVERLEEVPRERFEHAGGRTVLQYRGGIIPVLCWQSLLDERAPEDVEAAETRMCLILADEDKRLCLQVDAIEDILETEIEIKSQSSNPLFIGASVIDGKATELVDVYAVLEKADPNWFNRGAGDDERPSVLFVEDALFFRTLLAPLLESMHFDVWQADDGGQACQILRERTPDLILTDLEMPNMDGYALAEWARGQERLTGVPIAALTAKPPAGEARERLKDFDAVLLKMDRPGLIRYLQDTLGKKLAAAQRMAWNRRPREVAHG